MEDLSVSKDQLRPISVLPVLSKVFEKLVAIQIFFTIASLLSAKGIPPLP